MVRKVVVVPYEEAWPARYASREARLAEMFGERLLGAYHVGSTSVPGMWAKPIIDIMLVVRDIDEIDGLNEAMARAGYFAKGENGIEGRRFFYSGVPEHRSEHVHVFASDSPHIARHLALSRYLRSYPEEAQSYSDLKRRLAQVYPLDIHAYVDGKDAYVKALEQRALQWYRSRKAADNTGSGGNVS